MCMNGEKDEDILRWKSKREKREERAGNGDALNLQQPFK